MFDPVNKRERLTGNLGCQRYLRKDKEELRRNRTRLAYGGSAMNVGIGCFFCGEDDAGKRLLKLASELITEALADDEAKGHYNYHIVTSGGYYKLAFCHWMLHGKDGPALLASFLEHDKLSVAAREEATPDRETLDISLPMYLNAGDATYVCDTAEATSKVTSPKNVMNIRSPRVMAYFLAKHKEAGQAFDEAAKNATVRFLDRTMDEMFLDRGLYSEAATWLKIAYWNDSDCGLTPREVLMKAYDHLPNTSPPA